MTKKISIILISVVIVISLVLSIYIPNRKKIEVEDISTKYETIEKNDKVGILQNGEIIIEPQYDEIIILNNHRAVFVCKSGENQKIVNDKNEEIFQGYDEVDLIEISSNKYVDKVLKYKKEEKYGLLSLSGKIITEAKYDEILNLGYKENELVFKQDGKYGILDIEGNIKIKNKYDEIKSDEYYKEEDEYKKSGYIVKAVTETGYRYGYYDNEYVQVLNEEYNEIARLTDIHSDSIYLIVAQNGQCGVFVNNSKIINTEYQSINYNPEMQIFIVEKTGQYGAINLKGVKILEPEYSELNINGIYIYGVKNEEQKVFDEKGNIVNISFDTVVTATLNSKYYIKNENGNYSIVSPNLEEFSINNYKFIEYAYDSYFIVTNEQDKVGIIDIDENIVVEFNYDIIQLIKGKNIIQAIDFETNKTDIYDKKFDLALEMTNANIEILENGIKVYNNEQEVSFNNNGEIINE